jgi:hypothetical protein
MALRPVMILAFVSPGSHRGTLAGELYLITHNCSHEPFFRRHFVNRLSN